MSNIVCKVAQVAKITATPFTAVGGLIHANAVQRNKLMDNEWKKTVADCNASGVDLATKTSNEFFAAQFKLIPYRIERMKFEWDHLCSTCCTSRGACLNVKNIVVEFRFLVRLLFVFMIAVMMGRQSIYPLLAPGSPFLEELKHTNPNW